jgi:nucleolar MIF4G domain-containing protein 1
MFWPGLTIQFYLLDSNGLKGIRVNPPFKLSRKDARKQQRVEQKQRKAQFFSAAPSSRKRSAEDEHADSPKRKKARAGSAIVPEPFSSSQPLAKPKKKTASADSVAPPNLSSKISNRPARSQREKDEDAYITYLESKLGCKPGKKFKGTGSDGLDGPEQFI